MKNFGTKQVVPLLLAALSALFLYSGLTKFGFWDGEPTPAFVPTIIAILLLGLSLVQFATSFKEGKASYHKDEFLLIAAVVLLILATYVIGMMPAVTLFLLLWLKVVEKSPWKVTLLITVCVMALLIGVFDVWLNVHFPEGYIVDTFF